jgi:hypothetical protein
LERNKTVVDNIFSFIVAFDITISNDDIEPQFVEECRRRNDWPMWKEASGYLFKHLKVYRLLDTSGYLYENIM